jgi:hypothetical protein
MSAWLSKLTIVPRQLVLHVLRRTIAKVSAHFNLLLQFNRLCGHFGRLHHPHSLSPLTATPRSSSRRNCIWTKSVYRCMMARLNSAILCSMRMLSTRPSRLHPSKSSPAASTASPARFPTWYGQCFQMVFYYSPLAVLSNHHQPPSHRHTDVLCSSESADAKL